MTLWIADIHNEYQQGINIEQIAAEGFSAVMVKATEGSAGYWADTLQFTDWIKRIRQSGMVAGCYHWLNNANGAQQAQYFLNRLGAIGGTDNLLCAVDIEDLDYPPSWSMIYEFVATWNQRTNNHPLIIYTGNWWRQRAGWPGASCSPYLWLAHYVYGVDYASTLYGKVPDSWWVPGFGGWPSATWLQFSSTAMVAGRQIDVSASNQTIEELRALTQGSGSIGGIDMSGETADFAASHVPVPDSPNGAVVGSHVAIGNIWAMMDKLIKRPEIEATLDEQQIATIADIILTQLDAKVEGVVRRVLGSLDDA